MFGSWLDLYDVGGSGIKSLTRKAMKHVGVQCSTMTWAQSVAPVELVERFRRTGKHQSQDRAETLLASHWAVDNRRRTRSESACSTHSHCFQLCWLTCDGDGAGRNSPPNRSMICSSATSLVGVTFGGGGTGGPFLSCQDTEELLTNLSTELGINRRVHWNSESSD